MSWKKIKSNIVYSNPYFRVLEDDVMQPNGKEGKYFVVGVNDFVSVIAEDGNQDIYLVEQKRYTIQSMSLEFVAGRVEDNEEAIQAAQRELKEEAGIRAQNWKNLGYAYTSNGITNQRFHVYLARDLEFGKQELDPNEDIAVKKFSIEDVRKMILDNKIIDGPSIVGFYKFLEYRN